MRTITVNNRLIYAVFLFLIVSIAVAIATETGPSFTPIESCNTVYYYEPEPIYDTCVQDIESRTCENTTTQEECDAIRYVEYPCVTGTHQVEKNFTRCDTTGYIISNITLTTGEYICSSEILEGDTIVTCDSRNDGNGDGNCTSGESCQRFVINGNSYTKYERNSADEFMQDDESFYREEITAEVTQ